jgi:phage-related tail protein
MAGEARKQLDEIEQTQEALRESIEQAKELADKAQELLQKHKDSTARPPPDSIGT